MDASSSPLKAVFGPVPSRRLGRSLGIDPVPLKTCNWNCVYCQLGRTGRVINRRRDWVPLEIIIGQVREALARISHTLPSRGRGGACRHGVSTKAVLGTSRTARRAVGPIGPRPRRGRRGHWRARGTSQAAPPRERPCRRVHPWPQQKGCEICGLARQEQGEIDWITFVGSGEPTLHRRLGDLVREVKKLTSIPVAVITNGGLLYRPEVRRELAAADAVLPSLDAGSERLYRLINRPHSELTFERHMSGLEAFRDEYQGMLWLEIMLLDGVNDSEEALLDLAAAVRRIRPDAVHLDVPSRPPAESWVRPAGEEGLMRASAILGELAVVLHPVEGTFDLRGYESVVDAIVGIITRHPMRGDQLERSLERWTPDQIREALVQLAADGRAQMIERFGVRFWSAAGSRYIDKGCGGK